MKCFGVVLVGLCVVGAAESATFFDTFDSGINSSYWTLHETNPGLFAQDYSGGKVKWSKDIGGGSSTKNIRAELNIAALGGPVAGDFSVTIEVDSILVPQAGINQVELRTAFQGGGIFVNSFSNEGFPGGFGLHVWDGGFRSGFATTNNFGVFKIERVGTTLSAYFSNQLVYSKSSSDTLNYIDFIVQNFAGDAAIMGRFDNFSFTAASVPEPGTLAVIGVAMAGLKLRRRGRQKQF